MSRIVFAGTPETAVPSLHALVEAGHEIAAVLTRPDAPVGRKRVLTPSPVAAVAEELGLEVIKASRIDDATQERLAGLHAELGAVVAYGGLLPRRTLDATEHGWVNLHFSLLPRWRGAAPVQRSLMAGDTTTGASVFLLEEGLDTGPVLATSTEEVRAEDTAGILLARMAVSGAQLLAGAVSGFLAGDITPVPQSGEATTAPKLTRADGRIDFTLDAAAVRAHIAGVTPEPGAFTGPEGAPVKLGAVAEAPEVTELAPGEVRVLPGKHPRVLVGTGSHAVELGRVQPAGKREMAAGDWARGLSDEDVRWA